MKTLILLSIFILSSCASMHVQPKQNYSFYICYDYQDNVLLLENVVLHNWNVTENKPANDIISIYHSTLGRKGNKSNYELQSNTFEIDSILVLNYKQPYQGIKMQSSYILYLPDVYENHLQHTEELQMQVFYNHEFDLYLND